MTATDAPYLSRETSTLLTLLGQAARDAPEAGTPRGRRRLVGAWLDSQDRFTPADLLEQAGHAALADTLTRLCVHGDVSASIWRLAHAQFGAPTPSLATA